jgi:hypothetical protein
VKRVRNLTYQFTHLCEAEVLFNGLFIGAKDSIVYKGEISDGLQCERAAPD